MTEKELRHHIRLSLGRLEELAKQAEAANPFKAVDIAKSLGREQLKFNHLIAGLLLL